MTCKGSVPFSMRHPPQFVSEQLRVEDKQPKCNFNDNEHHLPLRFFSLIYIPAVDRLITMLSLLTLFLSLSPIMWRTLRVIAFMAVGSYHSLMSMLPILCGNLKSLHESP